MQWLPLLVSLAAAAIVAPAVVRGLGERGLMRANYRGALVAFPAGIAIPAAALLALVPLALLAELASAEVFGPDAGAVATYVLGVALLGLLDDLVAGAQPPTHAAGGPAASQPRGWRGHARATISGGFSTGALKAVGSLALALFVLAGRGLDASEYLLAVGVLVLATNLLNLLDLRPGRSIKALVVLGTALTLVGGVEPLRALGLFAAPALVLLPFDLGERAMLGDTGSNVVGAVAGLWLVLALSPAGQVAALGLIALLTIYGEFRSLSSLIERTPLLRRLDSLGRRSADA